MITDQNHPNSGVRKCEKTNQWVASLSMNGNQVFLGSFRTESQAWIATRKANGENNLEMPKTLFEAQQEDLLAVPMESIIDAYETYYDPAVHAFSLHNWTLAKINHYCSSRDKRLLETESCAKTQPRSPVAVMPMIERGRKHKGHPRRIVPKNRNA